MPNSSKNGQTPNGLASCTKPLFAFSLTLTHSLSPPTQPLPSRALRLPPRNIRRRLPQRRDIDHHLRRIAKPTVGSLVQELRGDLVLIPGQDVIPHVDAAVAAHRPHQRHVVQRAQVRVVVDGRLRRIDGGEDALGVAEDEGPRVVVGALGAADGLHGLARGRGAAAKGDALDAELRAHELGEDGAGAGAVAVVDLVVLGG